MDAADWDARYAEAGLLWSAEPNRFLAAEVAGLPPGRALDVACGEGRNAIWLATRGWSVTAVDHSEVGISKAIEMARAAEVDVDWIVADVTDYRPSGKFELVAVLYLHLPQGQMEPALSRAAESLTSGGTLLVVGHHPDNIEHGIGGPQAPEILYSQDDIVAMLDGLDIENAERVERPVAKDGEEGIALDALVVARRA